MESDATKRVLVVGAGQLGRALMSLSPEWALAVQTSRNEMDICCPESVSTVVGTCMPHIVINAAAFTAVDAAESNPEAAFEVNEKGVLHLATACHAVGAKLIHVSTDYVFEGSQGRYLSTNDSVNPLSVYGKSKLAGELVLKDFDGLNWAVIRTAWLYSNWGNNFLNTMLRLMAERQEIGVVCDQVGTPTSVMSLAHALWAVAAGDLNGIVHWTDAGVASWYDFAVAIQEEALSLGLLNSKAKIKPIRTCDFPTPALRPACVLLDKTELWHGLNLQPLHWREALRQMLTARVKVGSEKMSAGELLSL